MQKILGRRVWRDLKENKFRYLALGMLIILGMYMIVSLTGAAETVITGVEKNAELNKLEDGQFSVTAPLTAQEETQITQRGIKLEKMFYRDFSLSQSNTLRVFKNRESINLIQLDRGRLAKREGEAVLEKRYSREHQITLDDTIRIGGTDFQVVGIGTVPDYDAVLEAPSDGSIDSSRFGLAFIKNEAYLTLAEDRKGAKAEEYVYAYRLNGKITDKELKSELKTVLRDKEKVVTRFLKADQNLRIKASAEDQKINRAAGLIAGIIVMVLFTYVISVFVVHKIERESSVIGTLYALGVRKGELIVHYLILPAAVTFFAGAVGTAMGYSPWGITYQMTSSYQYYSLPMLQTAYSPYLFVYGLIMPALTALAVNCIVIYRKLSLPALKLIRNEQKPSKVSHVDLGDMGFISKFRIRQLLKELRTGMTVFMGMFIAMLILMLGLNCYVMCVHLGVENKKDTRFQYMYTYKFPTKEVPQGGEACFAKPLNKKSFGHDLEITLLGIDYQNPYFDAAVKEGKDRIIISSAMAQKYQLTVGDEVVLSDEEEGIKYAFEVDEITQYSAGLFAFMEIDSMRELFSRDADYFNVVLSDNRLDIEESQLYAVTTKDDISKNAEVFIDLMMPLVYMMTGVSVIIFCVVMYLMMKIMVDRSAFGISLIKIFGYRAGEINRLYLSGNFYVVAVSAAICIPCSKQLMNMVYPVLVSNVNCGMNLSFSWKMYVGIYGAILLLYAFINQLLVWNVKRVSPAVVLKNRE